MKNFGKMTLKKIPIKHPSYEFIGIYYDEDGVDWHTNYETNPHKVYAILQDDGKIISWQEDPEQSQIDGYDIWGFTTKEAKKRKDHTHFIDGKFCTIDEVDLVENRFQSIENTLSTILKLLENK